MKYMNFNYFTDYFNVEVFQNLCENGFFTIVERILKTKKIDIDKKLLFTVIKHGYLDMLSLLLKNGAFNINLIEKIEFQHYCNYMNFSLLGYSVYQEKNDIVKFLLEQEYIDVNLINEEKIDDKVIIEKTPLHLAIEKNNQEIVKLLIEHPDIDVNIQQVEETKFSFDYDDSYDDRSYKEYSGEINIKKSPLFIAVEENRKEIIEILLKNDTIDVNNKSYCHCSYQYSRSGYRGSSSFSSEGEGTDEKTILYKAIEIGNENTINLLLKHPKIDINLASAVIDDLDEIIGLIENLKEQHDDADDINKDLIFDPIIELPINIAIFRNDENALEILLSRPDIIIGSNDNSLFKCAVSCDNIKLLNLLLSNNSFDKNSGLKNSLQIAVQNQNLDIFNLLLTLPEINVNDCSSEGTALEIAIKNESMEFFSILLNRHDIDINENSNGKTALKTAVEYDNEEALAILLNQPGINVNDNSNNETALKIAVEKENLDIVKLLLNHPGINVNDNSNNKTALKIAVEKENLDIVKLLLNHPGIDVNDDSNNETALQIAAEKKNTDLVNLLITSPEIEFDPENIYKDVDHEKLKIILILVDAKKKKKNH